jgi:hypothetical protein
MVDQVSLFSYVMPEARTAGEPPTEEDPGASARCAGRAEPRPSHLWPYRGINRVAEPTFLHCLTGGARRLDHIWRGFASSIRTWQYRSANSTTLRPTSRPRKAICGRRSQQEAPTPAPLRRGHSPISALEMSFALAAASCYRP